LIETKSKSKILITGLVIIFALSLLSLVVLLSSSQSFYSIESTTIGREIQLPVAVPTGAYKAMVCVVIADEAVYAELRDPAGSRIEYWPNLEMAGFLKTVDVRSGIWSVVVRGESGTSEFRVSVTSNYVLKERSLAELPSLLPSIIFNVVTPVLCATITAYATLKKPAENKRVLRKKR
jgi:hypothetical protein